MRFVQKFGVAFLWASIVGLLLGSASYFRVERGELEGEPRWHVYPRLWLELLEARTVDWRARELGRNDERADGVVLINVDEDTLSNARESEHPEWAMRPWPRELLGEVTEQAVREGASMVFIDESFADVSARQCAPCRGEDPRTDDQRLAEKLRALGGKVVLGFDWRKETRRAPDRPLMPLLVRVAEVDAEAATFPWVQRVLLQRTTAYVVETSGRFTIWAGSAGEVRTRELANGLELKGLAKDANSAVNGVSDAVGLTEQVERAPYAMIGAALGAGYVLAGGLFTPTTTRLLRLGMKLAQIPQVRDRLLDVAEAAIDGVLAKTQQK